MGDMFGLRIDCRNVFFHHNDVCYDISPLEVNNMRGY